MSEIVYKLSNFNWGSPRYHACANYETVHMPDNYLAYDDLNGTADKYFPLYTITDSDRPAIEEVNSAGVAKASKNLKLYVLRSNLLKRDVGMKREPQAPYNSNMQLKTVSYVELESLALNPGWCTLQTQTSETIDGPAEVGAILVRVLGNSEVVEDIYAVDLDTSPYSEIRQSVDTIPAGVIYKLNSTLWECVKDTKELPPEDKEEASSDWAIIETDTVFNADVYMYTAGNIEKVYTATEDDRKFNPVEDGGDTLVCWNLSYFES